MLATNFNEILIRDASDGSPKLKQAGRKIVIAASGSRGDIQPYVALGIHLKERGNDVVIATEQRTKYVVEEYHLAHACLVGDPTGVLFQASSQEILKNGNLVKLMKITEEWDKQWPKDDVLASYVTACAGADLIIAAGLTMTQTYCVAEMLNIPWIPMILGPTLPTCEFPIWALANLIPCSCLNKWSYGVLFSMLWNQEKKFINPWRIKHLGLAPIENKRGIADLVHDISPPVIIACSPQVSGPKREMPADYPPNCVMSGFIFVSDTLQKDIDPTVVDFVNNDPLAELSGMMQIRPVIYLGFGSMPAPNPLALVQMAVDTCEKARCRAVLVAGWSDLTSNPEIVQLLEGPVANGTLIVVKAIPHDWLFPKMSAIIHHCGIGTTAAALRSGVPQVPCPFMLDQPHNAKSVVGLGCALTSLPYSNLTATKLSTELKRIFMNEKDVKTKAVKVGETIRAESDTALDVYCDLIESTLTR